MLDKMNSEVDVPRPATITFTAANATAMDSLGCISHIGRGGKFEAIKDRIKVDLVDCRWVEALSGALLFAEATDSPSTVELKKLVDFVDEIVFGPQQ